MCVMVDDDDAHYSFDGRVLTEEGSKAVKRGDKAELHAVYCPDQDELHENVRGDCEWVHAGTPAPAVGWFIGPTESAAITQEIMNLPADHEQRRAPTFGYVCKGCVGVAPGAKPPKAGTFYTASNWPEGEKVTTQSTAMQHGVYCEGGTGNMMETCATMTDLPAECTCKVAGDKSSASGLWVSDSGGVANIGPQSVAPESGLFCERCVTVEKEQEAIFDGKFFPPGEKNGARVLKGAKAPEDGMFCPDPTQMTIMEGDCVSIEAGEIADAKGFVFGAAWGGEVEYGAQAPQFGYFCKNCLAKEAGWTASHDGTFYTGHTWPEHHSFKAGEKTSVEGIFCPGGVGTTTVATTAPPQTVVVVSSGAAALLPTAVMATLLLSSGLMKMMM
jgi:hypothetical protein